MKYYTDFERAPSKPQATGKGIQPIYKFRTDKNGDRKIIKVGATNIYEKIQKGKSMCDIENIVKRFGIDLEKDIATFEEEIVDLTQIPKSLNDAHQTIEKAQEIFDNAPQQIKAAYNQNFGKFVKAVGTGEINEDLKKLKKQNKIEMQDIIPGQIDMYQNQTQSQTPTQTQTTTQPQTTTQTTSGGLYE